MIPELGHRGQSRKPKRKIQTQGVNALLDLDRGVWRLAIKLKVGFEYKDSKRRVILGRVPRWFLKNHFKILIKLAFPVLLLGLIIAGNSGFYMLIEGQVGSVTHLDKIHPRTLPGFQWIYTQLKIVGDCKIYLC